MIYFTVQAPRMYEFAEGEPGADVVCSQCVTLLLDSVRNGVLLVDDGRVMISRIAAAVDQWPEKYRKKGQALLERLAKSNRIVPKALAGVNGDEVDECCLAHAVANEWRHDCLLVPSGCRCQPEGALCQRKEALRLVDYGLDFPERFREPTLVFGAGENRRFEDEVVARIVRTARWVRLVDRVVGSKLRPGSSMKVPENFGRGLRWVSACVAKHADSERLTEFVVVTSYPDVPNTQGSLAPPLVRLQRSSAEDGCKAFAHELQRVSGVPTKIKMVPGSSLPHDRYLITDQVAIAVGQGFDLLDAQSRLRQCSVSLLSDSEFGNLTRAFPELTGLV